MRNRDFLTSSPRRQSHSQESSSSRNQSDRSPSRSSSGKPRRFENRPSTGSNYSHNRSSGRDADRSSSSSSSYSSSSDRSSSGRPSYSDRSSSGRPFSDRSSGNSSFSSRGRRFGGGRGGTSRSRQGSFRQSSGFSHDKYINKAIDRAPVEPYKAKHSFSDFKIVEALKKNIAAKKYVSPTPIQDQTIPDILEGKDLIGIANTGTGKTAAFLVPLINKVLMQREKGINEKVLIIVPTRELATQIDDELYGFTKFMNIRSAICIGGASIGQQIYRLKGSYNFVIGTPGRLMDLLDRQVLDLSSFKNVVLDEVDRMLDMGFINDIKFILQHVPAERHSLFFSATISREIDTLIRTFMRNPITVSVKTQSTSENVDQDILKFSTSEDKIEKLHELLIKEGVSKSLIFVKTKIGAERLDNELYKRGFKVASIHGDKTQFKRQQALDKFKENRINILVATDVAARGLDIPNVSHVINYDEPATYEDYVHRIGRTGRANNKGNAITFVK